MSRDISNLYNGSTPEHQPDEFSVAPNAFDRWFYQDRVARITEDWEDDVDECVEDDDFDDKDEM
jgi:hypothetical protein